MITNEQALHSWHLSIFFLKHKSKPHNHFCSAEMLKIGINSDIDLTADHNNYIS